MLFYFAILTGIPLLCTLVARGGVAFRAWSGHGLVFQTQLLLISISSAIAGVLNEEAMFLMHPICLIANMGSIGGLVAQMFAGRAK